MCIVMGADTATIPSLRQAPDVTCHFNETLHLHNNIDNAIRTIWVQGEAKERFCI